MQSEGIYIKVTTNTMHGLGTNSILYVCHSENWIKTSVVYVIDKYRFMMSVVSKDDMSRPDNEYIDWITICKGVMNGTIRIRAVNESIPSYADKVEDNLFLWRDVINPIDLEESDSLKFPFSNNAFYIDEQVNVFLKRQDPNGINGLYKGEFGEIMSKPYKESNNEYKPDEREYLC